MKNDCSLLPANPSSSILIRDAFAKSFTIQFSLIATVIAGNETVNNTGERFNNIQSTLASNGVVANNTAATVTSIKKAVSSSNKVIANGSEMKNSFKETVVDMRSNTVLHQRNGCRHAWKSHLAFVAIRSDIKETGLNIEEIAADIRGNAIVHRVNTHQHWWKPELTLKKWLLTLKKSLSTSSKQQETRVRSALK